jgi:hypothetical protein
MGSDDAGASRKVLPGLLDAGVRTMELDSHAEAHRVELATRGLRCPVTALAAYKDFVTLWKDAHPDVSILKQAKAEHAKPQ